MAFARRLLRALAVLAGIGVLLAGAWLLPSWWEAAVTDYAADLDQPLPAPARGLYAAIADHLRRPFAGQYRRDDVLVADFAPVALSQMACGLLNVALAEPARTAEVLPLLDAVFFHALTARRWYADTDMAAIATGGPSPAAGATGLLLTLLAAMTGAAALLTARLRALVRARKERRT
ncbi:MAG TPA: hypothetical protein PKM88_10600 [bacterium]|nr:hypothetical protein [bacterium]